ncbi:MAG: helix-turn-helix transcriptional regulator [Clostridium lundense]|nr:helix-turn-helix transcriptional regulator [Clostridium lundense]
MNKIKVIRTQVGLTIYKMAEITGLTPSYISNLENCHRTNPSREVMEKISDALGHTVVEVFFSNEVM